MLTIKVKNLSQTGYTFPLTGDMKWNLNLALLKSFGTVIANLGFEATVTKVW